MKNHEGTVRDNLCRLLNRSPGEAQLLNLDADLVYDFGLTSLDMIMMMTSICESAGIALTEFGEEDLARLRTPRDVIDLLSAKTKVKES